MSWIGPTSIRSDLYPSLPDAACAGPAGEGIDFFADSPAEQMAAIVVCAACPVRESCRRSAERRGEQHGVWGGRLFERQTEVPVVHLAPADERRVS